jgi:predicted DNA-binding transcriptional regulator YafY
MNRRGFLRAVSATGLALLWPGLAAAKNSPPKTNEEILRQALTARRIVQFKYHRHSRRVEPHALGRITADRLALLGWQVSGGSASEPPPGWRTFVVAEIESLKLARPTFKPRADYRPAAVKLKPIEAEVAKP